MVYQTLIKLMNLNNVILIGTTNKVHMIDQKIMQSQKLLLYRIKIPDK